MANRDEPQPAYVDGVPYCDDRCPAFDGKRCELMGFRPDRICEPEVKRIVKRLKKFERTT